MRPILLAACLIALPTAGCPEPSNTKAPEGKPVEDAKPVPPPMTFDIKAPNEGAALVSGSNINGTVEITVEKGLPGPKDVFFTFYRNSDNAMAGQFLAPTATSSANDSHTYEVQLTAPANPGEYTLVISTDPAARPPDKKSKGPSSPPERAAMRNVIVTHP